MSKPLPLDYNHLLQEYTQFLLLAGIVINRRRKDAHKRQHRWWVQEILQRRRQFGTYYHLVKELELDEEQFQRYFRLTREQFRQTLFLVEECLVKVCKTREPICPRQRLAICLRYVHQLGQLIALDQILILYFVRQIFHEYFVSDIKYRPVI